jgi:hypothetical protein
MSEASGPSLEQLQRALAAGLIDQATYDAAAAGISAQLAGGGAIAQGQDALAVGAHGVGIGGDNYGDINTGLIIQQAARPGASKNDLRRAYRARILSKPNQLPLFAGDSGSAEIRLSSVYTALLTQRSAVDAPRWVRASDVDRQSELRALRLPPLESSGPPPLPRRFSGGVGFHSCYPALTSVALRSGTLNL